MSVGVLYGVSVGPGDPELLTLKATRVIRQCPVVAVPRTKGSNTLALDIASQVVDLQGKEILYLDQLMGMNREAMELRYGENVRVLIKVLENGSDIALLNLGDVSIYSSCSYLADLVRAKGYRCEMIPGVTSYSACAALVGQSLADWDQPLHIYPGSYKEIDAALEAPGGKVLMKPAKALPVLREKILAHGLETRTRVVSDCGLPTERVSSIEDGDIQSYFTTLIIRP